MTDTAANGSPGLRVSTVPTPRVNASRLLRRIEELGRIGITPEGGVTRPAFSAADREAQCYLRDEVAAAGLHSAVDPAGNVIIRQTPGPLPSSAVLLGSHIDTVINGGRLDGAYGVIAALEVLEAVRESGVTPGHELVAVAFANEEGALFQQPFWGSMALSDQRHRLPDNPVDRYGNSLAGPLAQAGGDLARVAQAAWPAGSITAYLELHIEQGPVLEALDIPIGVVTDIVGRRAFDLKIRGQAGHAGTTPMEGRRDAAVAAAQIVLAVERIATTDRLCRVGTAGRLALMPDATNVVPGAATVSVELRDESETRLAAAAEALTGALERIAERTGCVIGITETLRTTPVPADAALGELIVARSEELGLAHTRLASGAGHDAQIMAAVTPMAMIFVPSKDGLSHTPHEDTPPENLVLGAEVLLRVALSV